MGDAQRVPRAVHPPHILMAGTWHRRDTSAGRPTGLEQHIMSGWIQGLHKRAGGRRGQGLVEYALILTLVVAVVFSAFQAVGQEPPPPMQNVAETLGNQD